MTDEHKPATEKHVTIVYCGGCNPHIDRTAVAGELPVDDPDVPPGATVHVSGCPRACASDHLLTIPERSDGVRGTAGTPHTIRKGDGVRGTPGTPHTIRKSDGVRGAAGTPQPGAEPRTVVIAGELVDGVPTRAADLAPTVTRKLKE